MFEQIAYAAPAAGQQEMNPIMGMMPLVLIFLVFYFLLLRPQQKKHKELQALISKLKKGDKVVTAGGIIGTVNSIQNDYLVLKVGDSDNTKIEILKSSISGIRKSS